MESYSLSLVQKLEAQDQGASTIKQGNNIRQQEVRIWRELLVFGIFVHKKDISDDQGLESNIYCPLVLWHVVKCGDMLKRNCRRMKIIAGCLPKERLKRFENVNIRLYKSRKKGEEM